MKRSLFALALAAALPLSAQAGEMSYTYVEGGYTADEFSGSGLQTLDGYYIGGSYNFADTGWFVAGSYNSTTFDAGPVNVDFNRALVGFGYHHGVTDNADLVVQLDYLDTREDAGAFGSASDNGYRLSLGFRGTVTEKFELSAMARYEDGGDFSSSGNNASLDVLGQYKFNETLGLTAGVGVGQRYNTDLINYNIGLRASF